MQLCYEAFAPVLGAGLPGVKVSNEGFVFEPLVEVAGTREWDWFEVEVEWAAGGHERWMGTGDKGMFELTRRVKESVQEEG